MEPAEKSAEQLRSQITKAETELRSLREQLARVEAEEDRQKSCAQGNGHPVWKWPLGRSEYERYGRQLILPQVGIGGQSRVSRPCRPPLRG